MAYDTGEPQEAPVPLSVAEQAVQMQAINTLTARKIQLQKQVDDLEAQLHEAEGLVDERKSELQKLYAAAVESVGSELSALKLERVRFMAAIDGLNVEIKGKQDERDNVLAGLSDKQNTLAAKDSELNQRSAALDQREAQIKADEDTAAKVRAELTGDMTRWIEQKKSEQIEIDHALADQDVRRQQIASDLNDLGAKLREIQSAREQLQAQQAQFDQGVAEAQAVLAQADAIRQMKADAEAQVAENQKQLDYNRKIGNQNEDDAQQIRVAKMALANQQADLNNRLRAIQDAEKKIGG